MKFDVLGNASASKRGLMLHAMAPVNVDTGRASTSSASISLKQSSRTSVSFSRMSSSVSVSVCAPATLGTMPKYLPLSTSFSTYAVKVRIIVSSPVAKS
jgi:hypothetical protein